MKPYLLATFFLVIIISSTSLHSDDISRTISYQGILTSSDGSLIENGNYTFTVGIYEGKTTSEALWTETQSVEVVNGIYTIQLGIIEPLNLDFDTQYWIGISVDGGNELNPRFPLSSVPYAIHAQSVSDGSITSTKLADHAVTQEKIHPDVSLPISGEAGGDLTGNYPEPEIADGAITEEKLHPEISLPISGEAGGDLTGSYPEPEIAVGVVTSEKLSPDIDITTTGIVEASSFIGDGSQLANIQVDEIELPFSAETFIPQIDGPAFLIRNTGAGTAIRGEATATSGTGFGVYGSAVSGTGVYGVGQANGVFGSTVAVPSDTLLLPAGVAGYSESGAGIYGDAGQFAWAGYFSRHVRIDGTLVIGEDLFVNGNITKGGGAFEIDHPLDPENMILRHSFVESPDMMNIYNGNVVTGEHGEAVVYLPDYFEALNMDFRYQLTVIGEFARAIIAEEIKNNHFLIRTDKPNVKVSWQITGIRKDRWAEENRIIVEENKTAKRQGFYIHPEAYGQPKSRSLERARNPKDMK